MGIGFPGTGTIHRCVLPLRVRNPDPLQELQMLLIAELSLHPGLQKLLMRKKEELSCSTPCNSSALFEKPCMWPF